VDLRLACAAWGMRRHPLHQAQVCAAHPCLQASLLAFLFVLESWNGLGWKGPYRSSGSNPPAMGRDSFHQTRLLRAPSNLALNTAREGAATASLGNLCQGLTTLMVKNFFPISKLNLPSFGLEPFPLVLSLHTLVKSPSPSFLSAPSGTGRLL